MYKTLAHFCAASSCNQNPLGPQWAHKKTGFPPPLWAMACDRRLYSVEVEVGKKQKFPSKTERERGHQTSTKKDCGAACEGISNRVSIDIQTFEAVAQHGRRSF